MKETDVHRAGCIAGGYVEDGAAAALEADGRSPAARDFGENCLHLAGNYFGDGCEAKAVLVAEREITEEVADGDDAASFERGGALRANAVEIFHRVGESDGHQIVCWFCAGGCTTFIPSVAVAEARVRFAPEGTGLRGGGEEGKTLDSWGEPHRIRR